MYEYYGMDITPLVMKELLIKLFDGKQFSRTDAIYRIIEHHSNYGGAISNKDYIAVFKAATRRLKNNGLVNCGYGVWRLNYKSEEVEVVEIKSTVEDKYSVDEIVGEGKQSIYVYYYDIYKKYAQLSNDSMFPCKIGRTDRYPIQRVIGQCGTCCPEMPHISLIINCEDSMKLESALHSILKYKNRWIADAPGIEWFMTNPDEIKKIYYEITSE